MKKMASNNVLAKAVIVIMAAAGNGVIKLSAEMAA